MYWFFVPNKRVIGTEADLKWGCIDDKLIQFFATDCQGWEFALWVFMRVTHFWTKRVNRSFYSFCKELLERITLITCFKRATKAICSHYLLLSIWTKGGFIKAKPKSYLQKGANPTLKRVNHPFMKSKLLSLLFK